MDATIKKAECQRNDAFKLWCWRRLLRVSWATKRSKQSILKEISPEYSLEGLKLKLKLQILWPPDAKNWLFRKDPVAGKKTEGRRRRGQQRTRMVSPTQWTWAWASSRRWWRTGKPGWRAAVHGVAKNRTWLSNWTTATYLSPVDNQAFSSSVYMIGNKDLC